MRFLVTGGLGFIGSHLVDALLARGDQVRVLDDASTGSPRNLTQHDSHPHLELRLASICDGEAVTAAVDGVDHVVHLAAAVGVRHILDQRLAGLSTNVRGTELVLAAAAAAKLPLFLASSSEVYGKSTAFPFRESDDCVLGPTVRHRWSYACAKALDEFLALAYRQECGLPVRIGRFFNTTGPRQSPAYGMVLPRFCAAARRNDELIVHGDGGQSRCFLHVTDAVSAILALLDCPAAEGQVVNIGGDEEVTMLGLAERVIAAAGAGRIRLQPYGEAFTDPGFEDLRRRVPCTAKLRQLTAWQPRYALADIIGTTLGALG